MTDFTITIKIELPDLLVKAIGFFLQQNTFERPQPAPVSVVEPLELDVAKFNEIQDGIVKKVSSPVVPHEVELSADPPVSTDIEIVDARVRDVAAFDMALDAGFGRAKKWTDARKTLLIDLRSDAWYFDDILPKLNEMPGEQIDTVKAVAEQYKQLVKKGQVPREKMLGRGRTGVPRHQVASALPAAPEAGVTTAASAIPEPAPEPEPAPDEAEPHPIVIQAAPAAPPPAPVAKVQIVPPEPVEPEPLIENPTALGDALRRELAARRNRTPPPLAAKPAVAPARNVKPLEVSRDYAVQWAAERGLANGGAPLDIEIVNAKRRHLGLSEFLIRPASGAARPSV